MKRNVTFLVSLIFCFVLYAQAEVTTFLGIPIDGTKAQMMQKLKAKGFTQSAFDKNALEGEFNGEDVYVVVQTNNNKVWRIAVLDANNKSEGQIKIRYNNLCSQFQSNARYKSTDGDFSLSDDEKISYEMLVNSKQYQASFYQRPNEADYNDRLVWFTINRNIDKYSIAIFYENLKNKANGEEL